MRFTFRVDITEIDAFNEATQIEVLRGEIEAADFDAAKKAAQDLALRRTREIRDRRGGTIGHRNLHVEYAEGKP